MVNKAFLENILLFLLFDPNNYLAEFSTLLMEHLVHYFFQNPKLEMISYQSCVILELGNPLDRERRAVKDFGEVFMEREWSKEK